MFFSVIIPTYNPSKYIERLLASILRNDCKNEIEVIVSDDKSEEDITSILDKYKNELAIVFIENDEHFGAPMKGRQNGADKAIGEWICFADQDDYFTDNAFDHVKAFITDNDAKNYLITDFYNKHSDNEIEEMIKTLNWTHGKFYQKSFWNECGIHYQNTKYCEDICLSVLVSCVMQEKGMSEYYLPSFTYVWVQRDDSLSKQNGLNGKSYFYKSFPDYIKNTLGVYVDRFGKCEKTDSNLEFYVYNITSMILHLYFYFQGMLWVNDDFEKNLDEYNGLTKHLYSKFLELMKWDSAEFLKYVNINYELYNNTREICGKQIPFIESETFSDWINK